MADLGFLQIFGTHSVQYTQICKWIFISDLNVTEEIGVQRPHQMKSHIEIMFIKGVSSMIYTCRYTICCTHNYLYVHPKPWNYSCVDLKKNSNAREFTRIHQKLETVSKCKYVCSRCMHFLYFAPFYRFPISYLGIIILYHNISIYHCIASHDITFTAGWDEPPSWPESLYLWTDINDDINEYIYISNW